MIKDRVRQRLLATKDSVKKFIERHARYMCASTLLLPLFLLGVATFWDVGPRWLGDDHPMRALLVIFIVLSIAWASQSVEIGVTESSFWVSCLLPLLLIFVAIAAVELLGYREWIDRSRDPTMVAILISGPIILIASRLRLGTRESGRQNGEDEGHSL